MFPALKPHLFVIFVLASVSRNGSEEVDERGFFDFLFSPCRCKCGVPNREARFLGGEYLRGYEFPWIVSVQVHQGGDPKLTTSFLGTLINNKYVITSASPLIGLTPYFVKVTVGVFNKCAPDVSSANVSVQEIIVHPDYNAENKANDIALLKLSTPVLFERRISPICLSVPGHNYLGQVATIAGWPEENNGSSCRPKKLGLPVLQSQECLKNAFSHNNLSEDKGCVGIVGTTSVVCKDDAGTPVMYRSYRGVYEMIGILTDQGVCDGKTKGVGLYTRVNNHLPWIIQNTRDACYCVKI